MKKTLLSIMVVAMSLFTFSAMAQDKKCNKKECAKETCDKKSLCDQVGNKRNCPNPFAGIQLTQAQQEKLDALKASCPLKDKKEDRKKNRQYRDSIARDAKVKHLAEIRNILTPEQYVQFLENMVLDSKMKAPKHNRGGKHKGQKCPMPQDCQKKKP